MYQLPSPPLPIPLSRAEEYNPRAPHSGAALYRGLLTRAQASEATDKGLYWAAAARLLISTPSTRSQGELLVSPPAKSSGERESLTVIYRNARAPGIDRAHGPTIYLHIPAGVPGRHTTTDFRLYSLSLSTIYRYILFAHTFKLNALYTLFAFVYNTRSLCDDDDKLLLALFVCVVHPLTLLYSLCIKMRDIHHIIDRIVKFNT